MSFDNVENKQCFCRFVEDLGDFKNVLNGFFTAGIALLTSVKALLLLVPTSLEDELRRAQYELELQVIEQGAKLVEAPLTRIIQFTAPYADCPPVANLAKTVKNIRDSIIASIDERKFEIQQYIQALDDSRLKIAQIDRMISILKDMQEGFSICGTSGAA